MDEEKLFCLREVLTKDKTCVCVWVLAWLCDLRLDSWSRDGGRGGSREKNAEKKNERLMDRTFGRRPVSVESLCTVFEVDVVHSDSVRFVCCPVMLVSVALVLSCYMIIQGFPLKTQTWNTQKEDWSFTRVFTHTKYSSSFHVGAIFIFLLPDN